MFWNDLNKIFEKIFFGHTGLFGIFFRPTKSHCGETGYCVSINYLLMCQHAKCEPELTVRWGDITSQSGPKPDNC